MLGEFRVQPLREHLRPRTVGRRRLDLVEIGEHVVERLPAKLAASVRVRLQRRGRRAQSFNLGAQLFEHQPWISRAASSA